MLRLYLLVISPTRAKKIAAIYLLKLYFLLKIKPIVFTFNFVEIKFNTMIFKCVHKQGQDVCLAVAPDKIIPILLRRANDLKSNIGFGSSEEYCNYISKARILDEINIKYNLGRSFIDYLLYKNVVDRYKELAYMCANKYEIRYENSAINFKLSELKNYQEANNLELSWLEFSEK